MEYVKVDLDIRDNFKFIRFQASLNIGTAAAVGHLTCLWAWAFRHAPDGFFDEDLEAVIAKAAQWEGNVADFIDALLNCGGKGQGFLERVDGGYLLHEWEEYCGKTYEKRAKNAERMRNKRAHKSTSNERTEEPNDCKEDVQRTCNAQDTNVRDTLSVTRAESESEKEKEKEKEQKIPPLPPPPGAGGGGGDFENQSADARASPPSLSQVIGLWNDILASPLGFPRVAKGSPERECRFAARLSDDSRRQSLLWWETLFKLMALSDFLRNSAKENARWLSFDWVLNESNLVKITEGRYNSLDEEDPGGGEESRWVIAEGEEPA
jgi:hypothetical protein